MERLALVVFGLAGLVYLAVPFCLSLFSSISKDEDEDHGFSVSQCVLAELPAILLLVVTVVAYLYLSYLALNQ